MPDRQTAAPARPQPTGAPVEMSALGDGRVRRWLDRIFHPHAPAPQAPTAPAPAPAPVPYDPPAPPPVDAQAPEVEPAPAPAAAPEWIVTDFRALCRGGPPGFASTGALLPVGLGLRILEEATRGDVAYVRVDAAGPVSQAVALPTWTVRANLGSPRDYDAALVPETPLDLDGLSGARRDMAQLYNLRGRFIQDAAQRLSAAPADMAAVLFVETRGWGFDPRGRLLVRLEAHKFHREWGIDHPEAFDAHFTFNAKAPWTGQRFRADPSGPFQEYHGHPDREWAAFEHCRALDAEGACRSISMGVGQIMGFNHALVGYASAAAMLEAFQVGVGPQLEAVVRFIEARRLCSEGLREGDHVKFAEGYNGPGDAHAYGARIADAAAVFEGLLADA